MFELEAYDRTDVRGWIGRHGFDRRHRGAEGNRPFGYVCGSVAGVLDIREPSSARELMPSLR